MVEYMALGTRLQYFMVVKAGSQIEDLAHIHKISECEY